MIENIELVNVVIGRSLTIHLDFKPYGWATFVVNDAQGTLIVESDWGSYSYRWGRGSWLGVDPPDLSAALANNFSLDYVATKLFGGDYYVYDERATQAAWRRHVLGARRLGELSRREARIAWNHLDTLDFASEAGLINDCSHRDPLAFFHAGEPWNCVEHQIAPRYLTLKNQLLPLFREELRKVVG